MKTSVVDMDLLVRQVIQTWPPLHASGTEIKIEGYLPKVPGHPAVISQCISNIPTNAVKFVEPGTRPVLGQFEKAAKFQSTGASSHSCNAWSNSFCDPNRNEIGSSSPVRTCNVLSSL